MPVQIQEQYVNNPQELDIEVAGPDGADHLYILTGGFGVNLTSNAGPNHTSHQAKETFSLLLGPVLQRRQFIKAIALASIGGTQASNSGAANPSHRWEISSTDADWDDESGQVELRIEALAESGAYGGGNAYTRITSICYQVKILAQPST